MVVTGNRNKTLEVLSKYIFVIPTQKKKEHYIVSVIMAPWKVLPY